MTTMEHHKAAHAREEMAARRRHHDPVTELTLLASDTGSVETNLASRKVVFPALIESPRC
jgi:hypothetical protein